MRIILEDIPVGTEVKISCNSEVSQDIDYNLLSDEVIDRLNHLQVQVDPRSLGRRLQPEQNEPQN